MFDQISQTLTRSRTRIAPSGYERVRLTFHSLRTAQFLSSLVVGVIMSFFMYHLTHDDWPTPWTFIVLESVSLLTLTSLLLTITLHLFVGLNPLYNIIANTCLSLLWGMGFGMLGYYMYATTLSHYCSLAYWHDGTGVMVCRIYKAVFSFSLLGLVSTLAALALDVHIYRLASRHGKHHRLSDDNLDYKHNNNSSRRRNVDAQQLSSFDLNRLSSDSDDFEIPASRATTTRGYADVPQVITARGGGGHGGGHGYAVPEGQFAYAEEDTTYRGNGGGLYGH